MMQVRMLAAGLVPVREHKPRQAQRAGASPAAND